MPTNVPTAVPTNIPGAGDLQDKATQLFQGSSALTALGQLGQQNGASEQVKSLANKLVTDNQGLTDQIKQAGQTAGVNLPDPNTPELQQQLDDLKQKSGPEFDQAWLQAVQSTQQSTQSAAEGLAAVPGLPPQLQQAAQGAADQLKAGQEQTQQAADAVGGAAGQGGATGEQGGAAGGATGDQGGAAGEQGGAAGGQGGAAGGATGEQGGAAGQGSGGSASGAGGSGGGAAPEAGKPYTVQRGDTLSSIAQRVYGNPADEAKIAEANKIANHDVIRPGQVINLP